jgi:hypothetical protein
MFKSHSFFYFVFIFNDLKCCRNTTKSSMNHLETLITIEQHKRNFFGVQEPALVVLVVCFFEFLTPFTLKAVTFSFLIHFQQLLVCQMCQEESFKFVWTPETTELSHWIWPALST